MDCISIPVPARRAPCASPARHDCWGGNGCAVFRISAHLLTFASLYWQRRSFGNDVNEIFPSMKQIRLFALAAVLSFASLHSAAGLFDDDEARKRIAQLSEKVEAQNKANDERFTKLDELIKNLGIIQLLNQIEQLNAEIARLRGQIEVLTNNNEQLQKRQRDFYLDIDTRLRALEGQTAPAGTAALLNPAPTTPTAPVTTATSPANPQAGSGVSGINASNTPPALGSSTFVPPAAAATAAVTAAAEAALRERENKSYDVGSNAFRRGDFPAAIRAFNTFISDFPQSQLVSNAWYWIGLSQFNLKDFREARSTQESLLKKYPDSSKAPDAMLIVASVQSELGDAGSARNSYEDIIAKYPTSDAAAKARTRLSGLRR
jgi:tol-pal system protein YbgF